MDNLPVVNSPMMKLKSFLCLGHQKKSKHHKAGIHGGEQLSSHAGARAVFGTKDFFQATWENSFTEGCFASGLSERKALSLANHSSSQCKLLV